MNKSIFSVLFFLIVTTVAKADVIYNCSPTGEDGDTYGSILIVGLGVKDQSLNIISDYLPHFSVTPNKGIYSYVSKDMEAYTDSGELVLIPNKAMLHFKDSARIKLQDGKKGYAMAFACKRLLND